MTTAAGALPLRLAALSLADPADSDAAATTGPSSSSSSSSSASPRVGVPPGEGANGRGPPPRRAWKSPPRRDPDHGGVVFMDELRSAWPVPSRDGATRKHRQRSVKEASSSRDPPEVPVAAAPPSSPESTSSGGDPAGGSVAASSAARPRQMQHREKVETWREKVQRSDPVPLATPPPPMANPNPNPRPSRPSPRPASRQQQVRPPVQNGHRGANPQPFSRYGNHGRHRRGVFPQRQPAQVFRGNSSNPMMGGFPRPHPDWGFNPMPNPSWVPNPQFAPPHMVPFAPPESMLPPGYFPGSPFPDAAVPYPAHPIPPVLHPPLVQNPWLMTHLAPPAGTAPQNPPANLPLPPEQQPHPREATQQDGESVNVRLRKQIEYYFSDQNLVRDVYLRRLMDKEGWVSAQTIASFPRVQSLTGDVGLVLEALQTSTVVEVSVDKMRRRGEWSRWLLQR